MNTSTFYVVFELTAYSHMDGGPIPEKFTAKVQAVDWNAAAVVAKHAHPRATIIAVSRYTGKLDVY